MSQCGIKSREQGASHHARAWRLLKAPAALPVGCALVTMVPAQQPDWSERTAVAAGEFRQEHVRLIRGLSLEERRGVADCLSRLSPDVASFHRRDH